MELENDASHWLVGDRQLPISRASFRSYIENASETLEQAGQFRWVIECLEEKRPVGLVDLYLYSERHQRASVGILIEPGSRGKGYAHEALEWLKIYSRNVAQLHQLHAEVDATNEKSIELFMSVGFEKSGLLKDWIRRQGVHIDVWQMQCIL